jgi:hypothetical protein
VKASGWQSRIITLSLVAGSLVCAAAAILGVRSGVPWHDPWLFPMLVVLPGMTSIGLALTLLASPDVRANVSMLCFAVIFAIYVLEAALHWIPQPAAETQAAPVPGEQAASFDTRSRFEVVMDLRAAGTPAYPSVGARGLRMLDSERRTGILLHGRTILPLAQLTGRTIVDCKESGQFSIFHTDERGFNNPSGLWKQPVAVAAVGDSYIQGSCVGPGETLVADIRRRVPNTVGMGLGDTGPLTMLGMIKEYLPDVRPADVFFFYYEGNDLRNLNTELDVEELRRYLQPGYTQGLLQVQSAIDSAVAHHVDQLLQNPPSEEEEESAPVERSPLAAIRQWMKLNRLRNVLALADVRRRTIRCCNINAFEAVLAEARRTVESWGGRLHFVYLPAAGRYAQPMSRLLDDGLRYRGHVLRAASRVGLPIVDVDAAFRATGNPRSLSFNPRSHFNPAGYRVAADAVLAHLDRVHP